MESIGYGFLIPFLFVSIGMETDLAAFGMWSDRPDMADPAVYVETIRKPRFR